MVFQPTRKMMKSDDDYVKQMARREGGLKSNGDVKKSWVTAKLNNPNTRAKTKEALKNYNS